MKNSNTLPLLFLSVLLTACGGGGGSDKTTTPTLPPANVAPTANAGVDQSVSEEALVTLSGSGTDSDGSVASYAWVQSSGTTVTLSDSSSATTTFTAPSLIADATFTFALTVTDDDGASSSDSVDVIVQPLPTPVTVNISEQEVSLERWEDQAQLSIISVTDAQGEAIDNPEITWESSDSTIASVENGVITSGKNGDATITVTATNDHGSASGEVTISVDLQRNSACLIPSPTNKSSAKAAFTYGEVMTNTSTKVATNGTGQISFVDDFNNDGRDDMLWVVSHYNLTTNNISTTHQVLLSNQDNTFTEATSTYLPEGLPSDMPRQIYKVDVNGDNTKDFIALQQGYDPGGLNGLDCSNVECPGAPTMIITWDSDGKLRDTAPTALSPYDTNGFTHAGGVSDVDCDGDIDLLEGQLGNELASAKSHIQLNDSNGVFTEKVDSLPVEIDGIGFYGSALCDLDMDGDPDIYIAQLGILDGLEAADVILSNDGFGKFRLLSGQRSPTPAVGILNQRSSDLKCFDFDGDGYNDILKPNEADENFPAFELLRNNGNMTFSDVTNDKMPITPTLGGAYRPFITDLNNDGWMDILAQGTGDYIRIYWNTGDGFNEQLFPENTAIDTRGTNMSLGDFNGDEKLDIHISRDIFESFILIAN
jgi:hypothetical protein